MSKSAAIISPHNLSEDLILKEKGWHGAEGYNSLLSAGTASFNAMVW
jgi:hypothetical protein